MTAARTIWHLDGHNADRELIVPLVGMRTPNPLNGSHSHWAVKSRARKHQRNWAKLEVGSHLRAAVITAPCRVVLTRCGPSSGLDGDGLQAALKAVRDGIADALGINDRDPCVEWLYEQRREKTWSVEVRVRRINSPRNE